MSKEESFVCKGCGHSLTMDYKLRTECYCYLCDPNISLTELLSNNPIRKNVLIPKTINISHP